MKLTFIDINKSLCQKVKKLFKETENKTWFILDVFNWDVFEYKKLNPDFKICTASNPNFSMWWWLDKSISENYPYEVKNLKEFIWTENLFPIVTVDNNITSSKPIIKRALAWIFAYRYRFDFILTWIWTAIWWLSELDFIDELISFLSADLSSANLRSTNLRSTNLSYADLRYANLSYASLSSANLKNIIINELTINFCLGCPEEWDFIGWKQCMDNTIVKLLIPAKAKRSSATTRKCRASYVKVLNIYNRDWEEIKETSSRYNNEVKYKLWKITRCDKREKDRWIECAWWIHFFITRMEAEQYN